MQFHVWFLAKIANIIAYRMLFLRTTRPAYKRAIPSRPGRFSSKKWRGPKAAPSLIHSFYNLA